MLTNKQVEKLKKELTELAHSLFIDDEGYLDYIYYEDDGSLILAWSDDEGEEYQVKITDNDIKNCRIEDNEFYFKTDISDEIKVLFLKPYNPLNE